LIKQGAKLIENTDDILEEILPQFERTIVLKQPVNFRSEAIAAKGVELLSTVDQKIVGFVSGGRVHIDDLISSTGLSSADILSALTTLELKEIVQQHPGKFFSLKK
jgi:DNA processing protein